MKKLLHAGTTVLAVAAPFALIPTPANAASPRNRPCITKAEFNAIDVGMRPARVKQIVGSLGRMTYYSPAYPKCPSPATKSFDIKHCTSSRVPAMVNFERRHGVWRVSYAIWNPPRD